jgi:RNA polymerase subunit RPABC4/transcription elongation factor Spt4
MRIPEASKTCPICGYEFPQTKWWVAVVALFLILLFLFLLIF